MDPEASWSPFCWFSISSFPCSLVWGLSCSFHVLAGGGEGRWLCSVRNVAYRHRWGFRESCWVLEPPTRGGSSCLPVIRCLSSTPPSALSPTPQTHLSLRPRDPLQLFLLPRAPLGRLPEGPRLPRRGQAPLGTSPGFAVPVLRGLRFGAPRLADCRVSAASPGQVGAGGCKRGRRLRAPRGRPLRHPAPSPSRMFLLPCRARTPPPPPPHQRERHWGHGHLALHLTYS